MTERNDTCSPIKFICYVFTGCILFVVSIFVIIELVKDWGTIPLFDKIYIIVYLVVSTTLGFIAVLIVIAICIAFIIAGLLFAYRSINNCIRKKLEKPKVNEAVAEIAIDVLHVVEGEVREGEAGRDFSPSNEGECRVF